MGERGAGTQPAQPAQEAAPGAPRLVPAVLPAPSTAHSWWIWGGSCTRKATAAGLSPPGPCGTQKKKKRAWGRGGSSPSTTTAMVRGDPYLAASSRGEAPGPSGAELPELPCCCCCCCCLRKEGEEGNAGCESPATAGRRRGTAASAARQACTAPAAAGDGCRSCAPREDAGARPACGRMLCSVTARAPIPYPQLLPQNKGAGDAVRMGRGGGGCGRGSLSPVLAGSCLPAPRTKGCAARVLPAT